MKRIPMRLAEWRRMHRGGVPHKALWSEEIEAFVNERLATMTFKQLAVECLERFGAKRAPRRSALHRYWKEFFRPEGPEVHRRKRRRAARPAGKR